MNEIRSFKTSNKLKKLNSSINVNKWTVLCQISVGMLLHFKNILILNVDKITFGFLLIILCPHQNKVTYE